VLAPTGSHRSGPVRSIHPYPPRHATRLAVEPERHVNHNTALATVIDEVIRPAAVDVDSGPTYPRAALRALGDAGILGLLSATEVGGAGGDLTAAAEVIGDIAQVCGSTAMVVTMHYAASAVIEAHGPREVREAIAEGDHVTTLAFSEVGSRSHFWAPGSTARRVEGGVELDARKSWVTSAGEANSYVWSSRPIDAEGPMSLWLVPADAPGLIVAGPYDGFGMRGNASRPMTAAGVVVPEIGLGADGAGLDVALAVALPVFLVLNAATSIGIARGAVADTIGHVTTTRLEHLDQTLAQQPATRQGIARLQLDTDLVATLLGDTVAALAGGREDAPLRMLEIKAAADEMVTRVTDGAMRLCGGAAFRKELAVERRFRDARAARVMAPTTEALLEFTGRALCGFPLLGDV
jgi:alkylation response protein AidB-like acyl-CoA dehydrogenase